MLANKKMWEKLMDISFVFIIRWLTQTLTDSVCQQPESWTLKLRVTHSQSYFRVNKHDTMSPLLCFCCQWSRFLIGYRSIPNHNPLTVCSAFINTRTRAHTHTLRKRISDHNYWDFRLGLLGRHPSHHRRIWQANFYNHRISKLLPTLLRGFNHGGQAGKIIL